MLPSRGVEEVQRECEFMRTVDAVNKFVISTTQFLNRFSARCDSQFFDIGRSLQRLEVLTVLLEGKLNSIADDSGDYYDNDKSEGVSAALPSPSLEAARGRVKPAALSSSGPLVCSERHAAPPMPGLGAAHANNYNNRPPPSPPPPPPAPAMLSTLPQCLLGQSPAGLAPPPPMPLMGGFTMCAHPQLQGYFQMLALRVPAEVIKAKMQMDGHQPEWLDTPDAPAPPMTEIMKNTLHDSD